MTDSSIYTIDIDPAISGDKYYYALTMFPYPSGYGLHVGHASVMTINDIVARFKRMQGYKVLNPFGFDSFGLPTENYAMKQGKPAYEITKSNGEMYLKQVEALNMSFDMSRVFYTSDPEYYKWTQRIFWKLFEKDLVYRAELRVNRCPECQTVLANDQVVDGKCERCSTEIIQKKMPQWFIKITAYADRLIKDLDLVDRPEETKTAQRNWIGRSEGAEIEFEVSGTKVPSVLLVDAVRTVISSDEVYTFETFALNKELADYLQTLPQRKIVVTNALGEKLDRIKELLRGYDFEIYSLEKNPSKDAKEYFEKLVAEKKLAIDELFYFDHLEANLQSARKVGIQAMQYSNNDQIIPVLSSLQSKNTSTILTVFTTRPDTLFGVTAVVLAPENTSLDQYIPEHEKKIVNDYRVETSKKTAVERQQSEKEKSGVFSGMYVTHPLTGEQVPVRFADYVLPDYATGAVMFVPAHDERDFEFAQKNNLPVRQVIRPAFEIQPATTAPKQERNGVYAIVKHPTEDKYLIVQEKENEYGQVINMFTAGGIEAGDTDLEHAMKREIAEETGYYDIQSIEQLPVSAEYTRGSSSANYYGYYTLFFVQLGSLQQHDIGEHLTDKHDILWLTPEEIQNTITLPVHMYAWATYNNAYTGNGKLVNSGSFDGLENMEAKKAITDHLISIGKGSRKVNYKLRDRSVSRQRYRGSPIPVYYDVKENPLVPFFKYTQGHRGFKEGEPVTTRATVQAIVKDKNSDMCCFLKWTHDNDVSGFFGGIEEGETALDAGLRELKEEGGFENPTFVKQIAHYHLQFYHPTKNRNQYSVNTTLYFEVERAEQKPVGAEETIQHTTVWMTAEEFLAVSKNDTSIFCMNMMLGKEYMTEGRTMKEMYNEYNPAPSELLVPKLIPEDELPVVLPLDVENYKPKGKSPLEEHPTFPFYKAKDGKTYLRECDTLDTFMCSSFYFLRFVDAHNPDELVRKERADKLLPIDFYSGGKEHTVGHLLYSRFIHKFLHDEGYVPSPEPFVKLVHQGMVLAHDGRKMGKRYGNVIDPLDVIAKYNSDSLRTYLMFMGPVEADKNWNDNALQGVHRFLDRVRRLPEMLSEETNDDLESLLHKTIKGVTEDLQKYKFNTAVSKLMILVNKSYEVKNVTQAQLKTIVQLLAPFATELAEELRLTYGGEISVHLSTRPIRDDSKILDAIITLPVQINGKKKFDVEVAAGLSEDEAMEHIKNDASYQRLIGDAAIKKVIYVQDKIVNLIV